MRNKFFLGVFVAFLMVVFFVFFFRVARAQGQIVGSNDLRQHASVAVNERPHAYVGKGLRHLGAVEIESLRMNAAEGNNDLHHVDSEHDGLDVAES